MVGMVPICPVLTESLWSYFLENVPRCSMELCRQMHGFTLVVVRVVQTTNLEGITHGFLPWKDAMCKRVVSSRPTTLPGLLQLNLHCAWINDGLNWAASNKTSHAFCLPVSWQQVQAYNSDVTKVTTAYPGCTANHSASGAVCEEIVSTR